MQPSIRVEFERTPPQRLARAACIAALAISCQARADWVRDQELVTVPTNSGMHLGASVAYDYALNTDYQATRLYVGAPLESAGGLAEAGVVYVFNPSAQGWVYFTTLTANLPKAGAHFGARVASGQGYFVVSAPDYDDAGHPGAGYIEFFRDAGAGGVSHEQQLIGGSTGNHLGRAIAISGVMAAASYLDSSNAGCVATFRRTQGAVPPWNNFPATQGFVCGAAAGDVLGASVAILQTGSTTFLAVAGAPGETHNGQAAAGGAHVYAPDPGGNGLLEVGTLAAQNAALLDSFGTSVGIDAGYVYVGATGRDNGSGRTGSVTIFQPASPIGYNVTTEIFPQAQADTGGLCGAALAVDPVHSQFVLGCPSTDGTVADEGVARVYRPTAAGSNVWQESVLTFGNLPHGADDMGRSLAILGDSVFAGAPLRDASATDHGAVEVFAFDDIIFADGFE